jgi:hypothetical protein
MAKDVAVMDTIAFMAVVNCINRSIVDTSFDSGSVFLRGDILQKIYKDFINVWPILYVNNRNRGGSGV